MRKITVDIPQAEAIKRGQATWGPIPIDLTAVLAELTEEEREHVSVDNDHHLRASRAELRYNGGMRHDTDISSPTPDTGDVVAAIRASIATIAAVEIERAERLADAITELEAWVAEHEHDPATLVYESSSHCPGGRWLMRDTPAMYNVPDDHPVRAVVNEILAAGREIANQRDADDRAAHKEAENRADARKAAKRAAYEAERTEWITEHGSRRLRMLAQEDLGLAETYRNERLAFERPEWEWYADICGQTTGLRDATEEALDALVAARETVPDARLEWLEYGDCECHAAEESDYTDLPLFAPRPVLTAGLLGRIIMREI